MSRRLDAFTVACTILGSLLLLFIVAPLLATLLASSPARLAETVADAEVARSLAVTFGAGLLATLLGAVGGVPIAYLLARRRFRGRRLVEGLLALPVVIPHTAAGVALLLVFGRRGVFGRILAPLGLEFTDTIAGVTVAMLFVGLPFLVSASREAFALVDAEIERVALTDGATPWQAFYLVTLPAAWRGIFTGALMMWSRGISEFGAVVIIAYHPRIVPVLVYEFFTGYGLGAALPLTAVLIVVVLLVFVALQALLPRREE
ncbi:MAG: ABC transporter permease [Anaerolineae bacterium]